MDKGILGIGPILSNHAFRLRYGVNTSAYHGACGNDLRPFGACSLQPIIGMECQFLNHILTDRKYGMNMRAYREAYHHDLKP